MKVQANGSIYWVDWIHHNPHYTDCHILNGTLRRTATAHVSKEDNYDKNIGRKVSMTRALKMFPFTKTDRIKFWEAYHTMRGKW